MKLLTKAIEKQLPPLYAQEKKGSNAKAFLKLFTPWTHWTWYVTEYDPETQECFGYVDGDFPELGYFSLKELSTINGPFGLKIERDRSFEPTTLKELGVKL